MEYQKDLIAERDSYIKLHSTVVKWWRDQKVIDEYNAQVAAYNAALEEAAQAASEAENTTEADAAVDDSDYNASTGSYSGSYGKNVHLNNDELDQVANILGANNDSLMDLIKDNQ